MKLEGVEPPQLPDAVRRGMPWAPRWQRKKSVEWAEFAPMTKLESDVGSDLKAAQAFNAYAILTNLE
jgi:hypothetical protein